MKRLKFHRAIVAIAMMLIGWLPSLAHHFEINGVFYNVISTTEVEVTYKGSSYDEFYNEYNGSVVIPSLVEHGGFTYSVTSIGNNAFSGCWDLTSIQIPNSVTSIGKYAFAGCESLTSIEIPNSVTSIGNEAFMFCKSLTSIQIPDSVTSIGNYAFSDCSSLTSIEIPNSVTSIGNLAFSGCSSLTSIVIPNSVTSIGDGAFIECTSLTSIQIPNSVTNIGGSAFGGCSSLTSIQIPNSVTSIGDRAFIECTSLTSVEIGNSVTSIGYQAFRSCYSLTSIEIGKSVTSIGDEAFYYCESLTSIQIPNSVTTIGEWAFYHCESLTSIQIPNSVTSIGNWAFGYCESLTSIQIPNSVTIIGDDVFSYCKRLTSIQIPNSVTSIGNSAFYDCKSLRNIQIPNSVTSIGNWAFEYCSMTSIQIPNSVTSIGNGAFMFCKSLTSVEIGNSVTSIGNEAFSYCERLTKITCLAMTPPTIRLSTFSNYSAELYVPAGCISAYQSANHWKKFYNIKEIPTLSTSIALNQTTVTLKASETITLVATILPENATDKSVEWSSSDETVAVVDENGVVTAVAVGEATITAITADGSNLSATCKITVAKTLAESVTLDKTSATLKATETLTLIATVAPATTTDKSVTWTSSNEAVATVDANGKVTAVAVGEATITATTTDGSNLSASCKVTVVPTLATSITLDKTEYEIVEKSDFQLTATILPESTTNKGVVWSSSDMWIASVDENGLVRAYSVGEAVITATTIDGSNLSASCKVTVVSSLAQSITLDKTEVSLKATETATLVATVLPETTSNKGVEWTSSDESVAIVSKKGVVTAIAVGEAVITATTIDGTDLSASCKVTVLPTLAESITLDKTEISLEATESATLIATVLPELTTNKSMTWTSSNEAVATVDENGVVTAVAVGEATITATTVDDSNLSASCKVTVVPTLAVSIELDQTEASVEEKSEFQLTATILPEHTTNKEVAWSSSKKVIATVDETGLVFVKSVGEVVITATTTDGSNLSATCRINVYSGIDGVNGDDVIVATVGDNIVVKNAQLGSVVNVYASNGTMIASEEATDGSVVVEAPVKGVYVVKVGKQTVKVIV